MCVNELEADELNEYMDYVNISEECIEQFQNKYPEHKIKLWHNFSNLKPTVLFGIYNNLVGYKNHCIELLERIVTNDTLDYPTSFEIVCTIAMMSTANVVLVPTPLTDDFGYLLASNLKDLFPLDDKVLEKLSISAEVTNVEDKYHIVKFLEGLQKQLSWRHTVIPKQVSTNQYSVAYKEYTILYTWGKGLKPVHTKVIH